ncbi:MAG: MATE family efflux transporter [Clostridiales bacterium]|jgi:putative MATE family efflux protein|nr:MATE family efflux transporter [Clostridiales bacterium]
MRIRGSLAAGDMTSGGIGKPLVMFALPLLLGYLLQQFYNAFDAIVVGNFVGSEALGAVGSSGPLINMLIAFAMGMFNGASALTARYFGSRDGKSLHECIHTSLLMSLVMGVALGLAGSVAAPKLLRLMGTPPEILPSASEYLRIYFMGLPALIIYNFGAATLTALGDSRRPLYFLIMSTMINVVGDLIFVLAFHQGIKGVAWSTVLAEIISAIMVIVVLIKAEGPTKLVFKDLKISGKLLRQILSIGLPGGIQGTIVSFSNVMVQSYMNGLGAISVAGYSAAQKLDAFVSLPVQTMAMACATFVAQNLGAAQVARARKGVRYSMLIGVLVSITLSAIVISSGRVLLRIFTPEADVLAAGVQFMWCLAPFHFILSGTQIIPGALRGAGSVKIPTAASILSFVGLRQIYLFFISKSHYTITGVALAYPITWSIAAIIICVCYLKSDWSKFEPKAPK